MPQFSRRAGDVGMVYNARLPPLERRRGTWSLVALAVRQDAVFIMFALVTYSSSCAG